MLTELVPKAYAVHRSLPLLGGVLDDFDDWMIQQDTGFSLASVTSFDAQQSRDISVAGDRAASPF